MKQYKQKYNKHEQLFLSDNLEVSTIRGIKVKYKIGCYLK
jgi:hypothetical protein